MTTAQLRKVKQARWRVGFNSGVTSVLTVIYMFKNGISVESGPRAFS